MGLYKQYFRITQYARKQLLGTNNHNNHSNNNNNNGGNAVGFHGDDGMPIQMLISRQGKLNHRRIAVILIGIFTLAIGIILSSIPWVDYLILKNLKLRNGSLSFQYWQRPGVIRLTKVYIFNVTNPDGFLNLGEKPRLQEIGPFVYKEDMQKVNVKFHENGTLSYQHKKILQFVPEMSVSQHERITVPNIPLLALSTQSNSLGYVVQKTISLILKLKKYKPFVSVTADELVFGYDDQLVALAHQFYPKRKRPTAKMGLLINRNGTLAEVHNIYTGTGAKGLDNFGLLERLNGNEKLPYWKDSPCNALDASEGSFFPPRYFTSKDVINIYDKDLCRTMPLQYRGPVTKHGISADLYTPVDNMFETVTNEPDHKCYCPGNDFCPPKGLQNISPCHFDAPVYLSYPHFFQADQSLIDRFDGLSPNKEKHQSYFKIQPKLGVPVEGKVRLQLNLKIDQAPNVSPVARFPSIIHPIMWIEEGIDDVTPAIRRWIYLATTFADVASPLMTYGFIFLGACVLVAASVNAYKSLAFTKSTIEVGVRRLRRGGTKLYSSCHHLHHLHHHHHHHVIGRRDTYTLLDFNDTTESADI